MIHSMSDLVGFLKHFHRRLLARHPADAQAPIPSPPGLALLYREFNPLIELADPRTDRGPFGAQDALMPLSRLKRQDGQIVFAWENQGNWSCRCETDHPDPPVYSDAAMVWRDDRPGFQRVCDSLDYFLITLCLQEAVMGAATLACINGKTDPETAFAGAVTPVWLRGQYVYEEPSHDFYVTPDGDTLIMDHAGLWIATNGPWPESLVAPNQTVDFLHEER
jgi:hypothetical protein